MQPLSALLRVGHLGSEYVVYNFIMVLHMLNHSQHFSSIIDIWRGNKRQTLGFETTSRTRRFPLTSSTKSRVWMVLQTLLQLDTDQDTVTVRGGLVRPSDLRHNVKIAKIISLVFIVYWPLVILRCWSLLIVWLRKFTTIYYYWLWPHLISFPSPKKTFCYSFLSTILQNFCK